MFQVITRDGSQRFDRWTDALDAAKLLIPQCKWFQEIRILEEGQMVWVYSRSHKYPQFIGAGTYDRLARQFVLETLEEGTVEASDSEEPFA
ncbi:hypothetical protein [Myxacorys almedinensis]|uniref:Uncharacterized protein n=1 Tax=Myxacorys almedinensis A TaxID=2690445 RepID=A0A8J7Z1X5_9CYAN|nr:hypothetical protein [Myxacorys almedinensis]NDJ18852.1 hypothetical protein [Myxacorys almedinensis A]